MLLGIGLEHYDKFQNKKDSQSQAMTLKRIHVRRVKTNLTSQLTVPGL